MNPQIIMNEQTLSLVKLAQELCNSGQTPRTATSNLLEAAHQHSELAYLLGAHQEQAVAELERRFSGYLIKPWGVRRCVTGCDELGVTYGYKVEGSTSENALEELGYSLECIRQLVELAEEHEIDAAVCVRVARRFLKKMEGGK